MKIQKQQVIYALIAVSILSAIYYFSKSNNVENNNTEVKTAVETKVTNVNNDTKIDVNTSVNESNKTDVKDSVKKDEVVYKNTDKNEGYNMELKIPEKWAKYKDQYATLGNPKEVELPKEDYLPGDKLYSKDDEYYYKEGREYFSADAEKALLDFFNNREAIQLILNNFPSSSRFSLRNAESDFTDYMSDINNLIVINEETGRKEYMLKINDDYSLANAQDSFCPSDTLCTEGYKKDGSIASDIFTEDEYNTVINFFNAQYIKFDDILVNKNKALEARTLQEEKDYACQVEGICPDGDPKKKPYETEEERKKFSE